MKKKPLYENPSRPCGNIMRRRTNRVLYVNAHIGGHLFQKSTGMMDPGRDDEDGWKAVLKKYNELVESERRRLGLAAKNGGQPLKPLTFAEMLPIYKADLERRVSLYQKTDEGLAPLSRDHCLYCLAKILEQPVDQKVPVRKLRLEDLEAWLEPILLGYSATYYNGCVQVLRDIFRLAVNAGAAYDNVATQLKHAKQQKKDLVLPTEEQWWDLIQMIRAGGDLEHERQREIVRTIIENYRPPGEGRREIRFRKALAEHPEWRKKLGLEKDDPKQWRRIWLMAHYCLRKESLATRKAMESADLVEFLTYTGSRIGAVRQLTLDRVTLANNGNGVQQADGTIAYGQVFFGVKTVKGQREAVTVPIHKELVPVIKRCIARQNPDGKHPNAPVFRIKDCRKAIQRACEKLGYPRWTHHDLRHLFATQCLEAGAHEKLTATLLGHTTPDMVHDRYGHARQAAARRAINAMRFKPAAASPAPAPAKAAPEIPAVLRQMKPEQLAKLAAAAQALGLT